MLWGQYEKEGYNPKSGHAVKALRQRLKLELELPMKQAYEAFIRERLDGGLRSSFASK